MSAPRLVLVAAGLIATAAVACSKKDPPAPTSSSQPAGSSSAGAQPGDDVPTAEAFCAHIDKLSMAQMEGSLGTPEEKQQMVAEGHASCVAASTEDRKNYPEWGPCAKCAMTTTDLATMEQKCDALCKALGDKLDQKGAPPPGNAGK